MSQSVASGRRGRRLQIEEQTAVDHARQALLRSLRQQPPSSLTCSAPVDLCQHRQLALRVPAPRFGATCPRLGVDKLGPGALRLVTLAYDGQLGYAQLHATPQRADPWVPDPQFATKAPAGRRSSSAARWPAPGGQPVPHRRPDEAGTGGSSCGLRMLVSIPDALPVRSPGAQLHPQLRRAPGAGRGGEAGSR